MPTKFIHYFIDQIVNSTLVSNDGWQIKLWTLQKIYEEIVETDSNLGTALADNYQQCQDKNMFGIYFVLYKYGGIFPHPNTANIPTIETLMALHNYCNERKVDLFESAELTYTQNISHPDLLRILTGGVTQDGNLMTLVLHHQENGDHDTVFKTVTSTLQVSNYLASLPQKVQPEIKEVVREVVKEVVKEVEVIKEVTTIDWYVTMGVSVLVAIISYKIGQHVGRNNSNYIGCKMN